MFSIALSTSSDSGNCATYVRQILTALLVLLMLPVHGHDQHTLVDEKTIGATGEISGFPSHQNHDTRQPGNDAILVGIAGAEKQDHPCFMEFTWARRNDTEHRNFTTTWKNEPCDGDENTDNSFEFNRLASRDGRFGIASLRVCNNNKDNKRLKGVEIKQVGEILESGVVSAGLNFEGKYERANCATWDKASDCDPGEIAVGVNIYFDDEGATGLELICAAAKLERELITGPITEPVDQGTQHQSALSGYAGEQTTRVMVGSNVNLPNAPLRHYGITSIAMIEHNNRPCQIKLFGRALDWRNTNESRMLGEIETERCGFTLAGADALLPDLTNESGTLFMVGGGVRCNSSNRGNDRIKGLKLLGGRIDDNGNILQIDGVDSDDQPPTNCGDFTRSVDVECRDSDIASRFAVVVGLEMQHTDDAFTGFRLICRDITIGEYPALLKDSEGF